VTTVEFENKWVRVPGGILAGDPRRFEVARVTAAVRQRVNEGMSIERAKERTMADAPYREALGVAIDPLSDDRDIAEDFRSIDAP
jgi:hypothetical protein